MLTLVDSSEDGLAFVSAVAPVLASPSWRWPLTRYTHSLFVLSTLGAHGCTSAVANLLHDTNVLGALLSDCLKPAVRQAAMAALAVMTVAAPEGPVRARVASSPAVTAARQCALETTDPLCGLSAVCLFVVARPSDAAVDRDLMARCGFLVRECLHREACDVDAHLGWFAVCLALLGHTGALLTSFGGDVAAVRGAVLAPLVDGLRRCIVGECSVSTALFPWLACVNAVLRATGDAAALGSSPLSVASSTVQRLAGSVWPFLSAAAPSPPPPP